MNIKSLLLGSAAALVAVSGARAADAVVIAEPEPMDYVRICDTYGAGYYYIPGTETCLSIRGLVRYQISFDSRDDDVFSDDGEEIGGWRKNAYARVDINAKSETELGTLTGYIRIVGTNNPGDSITGIEDDYTEGAPVLDVYMEYATITLGGLSMGRSDSIYDVDVGAEFDSSGAGAVHYISYTFAGGNGFSATVSLEEEDYNSDYVPNVVGRVGFTQGWGGVDFFVAYDDLDDNASFDDDGISVKAVGTFNFNEMLKLTAMGIYEFDEGYYSTGYEYSVAAFLEAAVSEKVSVGFGGQYFGDEWDTGEDEYRVGGEIAYVIVENFSTKLQVQYRDRGDDGDDSTEDDNFQGWLRFERSF